MKIDSNWDMYLRVCVCVQKSSIRQAIETLKQKLNEWLMSFWFFIANRKKANFLWIKEEFSFVRGFLSFVWFRLIWLYLNNHNFEDIKTLYAHSIFKADDVWREISTFTSACLWHTFEWKEGLLLIMFFSLEMNRIEWMTSCRIARREEVMKWLWFSTNLMHISHVNIFSNTESSVFLL